MHSKSKWLSCVINIYYALAAGLDKSPMWQDVLNKIMNFKNCCTWLFFKKYAHKHTFSVSEVCETFLKNTLFVQVCVRFLKPIVLCSSFMFHVLNLTIWNLTIVSKNNLQWSCVPAFFCLNLQISWKQHQQKS